MSCLAISRKTFGPGSDVDATWCGSAFIVDWLEKSQGAGVTGENTPPKMTRSRDSMGNEAKVKNAISESAQLLKMYFLRKLVPIH